MRRVASCFLLGMALAQQSVPAPSQSPDIVLAAVARDQSLLTGGIGPSNRLGQGKVAVEPLVLLSPSGEWKNVPCSSGTGKGCQKFARDYLSKPHSYTVVSTDGKGATIHAAPATLSECYDYVGKGTYSDGPIIDSAIASSSPDIFEDTEPSKNPDKHEVATIRRTLAVLVPKKLDSARRLRFIGVRLEGHDLMVVQRTYADLANPDERAQFIFVIGAINQDRFQILHWKKNVVDEEESMLGTIRLKSGREFLITVTSDPESHGYRIYGFRDGKLTMVYSGGGSSC